MAVANRRASWYQAMFKHAQSSWTLCLEISVCAAIEQIVSQVATHFAATKSSNLRTFQMFLPCAASRSQKDLLIRGIPSLIISQRNFMMRMSAGSKE